MNFEIEHKTLSILNVNLSSGKTRHHLSPSDTLRYIVKSASSLWQKERSCLTLSLLVVLKPVPVHDSLVQLILESMWLIMWVISAGNLLVRKDNRFQLKNSDNNFNLEISDLTLDDASDYNCEVDIMGWPMRISAHPAGLDSTQDPSQRKKSETAERWKLHPEVLCPWPSKSKSYMEKRCMIKKDQH